ncbi:hypothetical protein L1887_56490 [Cichorium endivia]|nr:hypothetical protein L1887_56490 [Cichorium endivia]
MLPLFGNFIQCKALGFDIQVWDPETGERIDDTGKPGELIVAKPFPTQPTGFFGPPEQKQALYEKYMDAYYTRFPGRKVWAQGDFIYQDKVTKGLEILGRSDGVLNPATANPQSLEEYAQYADLEAVLAKRRASKLYGLDVTLPERPVDSESAIPTKLGTCIPATTRPPEQGGFAHYALMPQMPKPRSGVESEPSTRASAVPPYRRTAKQKRRLGVLGKALPRQDQMHGRVSTVGRTSELSHSSDVHMPAETTAGRSDQSSKA